MSRFVSVCNTCECEGREVVSFVLNVEYSPDRNVQIVDSLRPTMDHPASEIRPVSGNEGTTLEISYRPGYEPFVAIDLDVPHEEDSSVDVEDILMVGNVQVLDIYYKSTDDASSVWPRVVRGVTVDNAGFVNWPQSNGYVSVGELKLVPIQARSPDDEYFTFTVDVLGCQEKYSESGDKNLTYISIANPHTRKITYSRPSDHSMVLRMPPELRFYFLRKI